VTDFTLPFHNYLGPGTPVFSNIYKKRLPTSYLDATGTVHDLLSGENSGYANKLFVKQALVTPEGVLPALAIKATDIMGKTYTRNKIDLTPVANYILDDPKVVAAYKSVGYDITKLPKYIQRAKEQSVLDASSNVINHEIQHGDSAFLASEF
jgi:hypothetical protein